MDSAIAARAEPAAVEQVARSNLDMGVPEGLAAADAAAYCGVSLSMWRGLDARGLCPLPARIGDGKCPRWSRTELRAWLIAGAPPRDRWVVMRESRIR